MKHILAALLLATAPAALSAQAPSPAVVTSADPRATEAGQEILRAGGSATDAAIAMMLALTVVEPQSSGIGGGGFIVHYGAKTGRTDTIDGREKAPASARGDRFLGADGKPKDRLSAIIGGRSVGVPGNLRAAELAHKKWGKLPWARLFEPAIRLAENGFQVTRPLATSSAAYTPLWTGQQAIQPAGPIAGDDRGPGGSIKVTIPEIAALYAPGGKPLQIGDTVRNPALAATLRRVAAGGTDAFYTGDNAAAIVATVNGPISPGGMTTADVAAYSAKQRKAVCTTYRTWKVCGMGPPSSGATTVFQILGMLERFDLKTLGKDNPVSWHLIAEAMRLAYADRGMYAGDMDFVSVPVKGLLDKKYVASRSALISPVKTLGTYLPGTPPGAKPRTAGAAADKGTTHFIAVDRGGDVVTYTSTVESGFGSNLLAPGGYILNNELTDFDWVPEKNGAPVANRVQPGKRPMSSMSPTIVYDAKGKPVFAVGAAGGPTIIMQVAKAIIAHFDWGLSARDSIGQGLVFFNNAGLVLEEGTSLPPMQPALEKLGHKVTVGKLGLKANAAERTPAGWVGAADPRSVGTALGE
jgi:gamma-glutamyltranspeptidase/glutathione hydrolase